MKTGVDKYQMKPGETVTQGKTKNPKTESEPGKHYLCANCIKIKYFFFSRRKAYFITIADVFMLLDDHFFSFPIYSLFPLFLEKKTQKNLNRPK